MRYDPVRDCYEGAWLTVPGAVLVQVLAARVRACDDREDARGALLEEQHWSLAVPGVRSSGRAVPVDDLPAPVRFPVAVLQPTTERASVLAEALEAAGLHATPFVAPTSADVTGLRAFLTPAPAACVFGLTGILARLGPRLAADVPAMHVVLTPPRASRWPASPPLAVVPFLG
jgi:hypothetical protein